MARSDSLQAGIEEASAALKDSTSFQKSKLAQRLRSLLHSSLTELAGDAALSASAIVRSPTVQSAEGSAAFSLVKEQVSNFAQNSKMIMVMLDELAKAHPFISSAPVVCSLAGGCLCRSCQSPSRPSKAPSPSSSRDETMIKRSWR
jgi:hypothetical protein